MIPGWISVTWRYPGENMMSGPGRGRCRSFCCGDGENKYGGRRAANTIKRPARRAGLLHLIELVTEAELRLPAAAEAGARSEAVYEWSKARRVGIRVGERRCLTIGRH